MSIFVTEIVDEEWGNYFELTGAGYGALIAVMIVMLLFACLIGNAEKIQYQSAGVFRNGNGAWNSDFYGQTI